MASENEEKYGTILGTVVNEGEKGVSSAINTGKQLLSTGERVGGYLKRDIGNEIDWLSLSPEEKAAKKAEEKAAQEEADEKAAKESEEKDKAEKAEKERLEQVKKSYIVHTAAIVCSFAKHESYVVVPTSHGEFIHGIAQLNVSDSKLDINIRSFGICRSPNNPNVKEAARKILEEVNNRPKSFTEKVEGFFSKSPSQEVGNDLASKCAGKCEPQISTEWIDGKDDVLVDGKPALLGRCTLQCGYGGEITFYTSGQRE